MTLLTSAAGMIAPHLTLFFAACCGLMQVALTAAVIARRASAKISLLDEGDDLLLRRIRAHGNFVETVPMALLLMALLELQGLAETGLWTFGVVLILGRALHAHGLLSANAFWARTAGMVMTLFVIAGQALVGLWVFWQ